MDMQPLRTLPLVLLCLVCWGQAPNQGERDRALSALHGSMKLFRDATAGLSAAQWNFKPAPDRWSIADIAEHLALTEQSLFARLTGEGLQAPASAGDAPTRTDDEVLKMLVDRSHKAQAPETLKPSRKFKSGAEAARVLVEARMKSAAYIRDTNDALRGHRMPHPALGSLDLYQWFLMLAGHCERHTLQALEVKAHPQYPAR